MTGSPLDPFEHMLISVAIALAAAALLTLSAVMFLRWLGLHWSWALPGVLLWPLLWPFDQRGGVRSRHRPLRDRHRSQVASRRPAARRRPRPGRQGPPHPD
jgi:hypothetical protein